MRSVLVALLVILGITSARADIVYAVFPFELFGMSGHAQLSGTIITDGALGALAPADIVSWQLTDVETGNPPEPRTFTAGSAFGSPSPTWTPGSITATAGSLVFDFGAEYDNFVRFDLLGFFGGQCGNQIDHVNCARAYIGMESQILTHPLGQQTIVLTINGIEVPSVAVPSPVLGAGFPGLMMAGAGLLGWWRRKRSRYPQSPMGG